MVYVCNFQLGRVDLAFVVDYKENTLQRQLQGDSGENRLTSFRKDTLQIIQYYDDAGKLVVVSCASFLVQ